jgi:hypothetical protein
MQRWLITAAVVLAIVSFGTLVYSRERSHHGPGKTYAVLIQGARQRVLIMADSIRVGLLNDKTAYFSNDYGEVVAAFPLNTLVGIADVTSAPQKPIEQQEVLIMGEAGCHGGGCEDGSLPCNDCGDDGWCGCSSCCVALAERSADWKTRDELAKEKARALAKKLGLSTEHTK